MNQLTGVRAPNKVQPEVEDGEYLRLGEGEDDDAPELGEGDPREHGAPHAGQHVLGTLHPAR